jgi:hypothetical protein
MRFASNHISTKKEKDNSLSVNIKISYILKTFQRILTSDVKNWLMNHFQI